MKKTIIGVLVNTQSNIIAKYSLEYYKQKNGKSTFLPKIYSLLNCSTIDIISRKFGDLWLDIVVDDEGLLKWENQLSVLTLSKETKQFLEQIVGNVFVCGHDDNGELVSLSEDEIQVVLNQVYRLDHTSDKRKVLVASL